MVDWKVANSAVNLVDRLVEYLVEQLVVQKAARWVVHLAAS